MHKSDREDLQTLAARKKSCSGIMKTERTVDTASAEVQRHSSRTCLAIAKREGRKLLEDEVRKQS